MKILHNLKFCWENIFWQNHLFPHHKKCFSTILGYFWKIEFLTEIHQARTLQKWWKFRTILNCAKNFFELNCLFHSLKERFLQSFRQLLENWIFDRNTTGADLTKIVKFLYYLKLWKENIFWLNYLFPSSKERFLQKISQFLENWIFCQNSTGADLTKIVKILYYLKLWKKIFFG